MSARKLLHSKNLIILYKEGKLDRVLKRFKSEISEKNFIGAGTHVACFRYRSGHQVLKLCTKNIHYFTSFPLLPSSRSHAQQFKNHINSLSPYLSPVNDILYEDEFVFIYTQAICRRFEIDKITPKMILKIFKTVNFLIENNLLLTDLAPNNFGFLGNSLVLFDYHDLQPISEDGKQLKTSWWRGIMKNLTRYVSALYAPEKSEKYERLMEDLDETVLEKFRKDHLLPSCFVKILQYILIDRNDVSEFTIYNLLNDCIDRLDKWY